MKNLNLLNKFRHELYGSLGDESCGLFIIPYPKTNVMLRVIASNGEGWEHISVSLPNRCPNWQEMCFIKDTFFHEEDCCCQFHPKKSEYVNIHPYCLHIWKPIGRDFDMPPSILVGVAA